jgi:hypothetical protein
LPFGLVRCVVDMRNTLYHRYITAIKKL